jgi:hypothetical protein
MYLRQPAGHGNLSALLRKPCRSVVLPSRLPRGSLSIQFLTPGIRRAFFEHLAAVPFEAGTMFVGQANGTLTTAESIIATQKGVFRGYENPAIQRAITNGYQNGALITFKSIGQLPLQLYPVVRDFYKGLVEDLIGENNIFTNTTPGHIWDAPIVYNAIPNTKFIFIKRDFHDLVLRIFMKHYRSGNTYSYDLNAIKRYITAYNKMIDLMLEAFSDDSIVVQCEDMVNDSSTALEQMCALCGLKPDANAMPDVQDDAGCSEPYRDLIDTALARA